MTFKQYFLSWNASPFGAKSSLDEFSADDLGTRSFLVCDPSSIVHLFPRHSVYVAAVDIALKQMRQELVIDDLPVLNSIQSLVNSKIIEIVRFLIEGGRLVYFLRPIFRLIDTAEQVTIDNYQWLDKFRPLDCDARVSIHHAMSLAGTTDSAGPDGQFIDSYLACFLNAEVGGIERQHLSQSYLPLALMNGNWVIAGYSPIGEAGGGIYFIPPPVTRKQHGELKIVFEKMAEEAANKKLPREKQSYLESSPVESLRKLSAALSIPQSSLEQPRKSKEESYNTLLDMLLVWTPEQTAEHVCNLFVTSGYQVERTDSPVQFSVFDEKLGTVILRCCGDDPDTILRGLSSLARTAISCWANREAEPKGILIATSRNIFRVNSKLRGIDFDPYAFGRKNNISLLTSVELAHQMRQMVDGQLAMRDLCQAILSTDETASESHRIESPFL